MSRSAIFFLVILALGLAILLVMLGLATIPTNLLGWFLVSIGLLYFSGIIIVYWIRGIKFWSAEAGGAILGEERNDRSFWLIVFGMSAAVFISPIEYLYFPEVLPRLVWMQIAGLLVIMWGSVLFVWARRTLGEFYSGHVSIAQGQPLVQHGPYRFIRHPAYAGYILLALGLSLGYSSLAGFMMSLSLLLPSVIYRIRIEDGLLAEHFGAQFDDYAQKVKRLIPGIW